MGNCCLPYYRKRFAGVWEPNQRRIETNETVAAVKLTPKPIQPSKLEQANDPKKGEIEDYALSACLPLPQQ